MDIYQDIAQRTDGSIYIGVVGPVRTGKSTLIRRFMDLMVVPEVNEAWYRERLIDELPQSGGGRTIMTTQISFVPAEPVQIALSPQCRCRLRMVDCVGYMVQGALGDSEGGVPRMVRTPWQEEELPFKVAAETGTRKVIRDHSTIALLVSCDGTIADIPRADYAETERRIVQELQQLGKPFALVINSRSPLREETQTLCEELRREYDVPVLALDVMNMDKDDIRQMMESVLHEFPVRQVEIALDDWVCGLPQDHPLLQQLLQQTLQAGEGLQRIRDHGRFTETLAACAAVEGAQCTAIEPGQGTLQVRMQLPKAQYYAVLSDTCGVQVENDIDLMRVMAEMALARREYQRIEPAWQAVCSTGYGLIRPTLDEMELSQPETVHQAGGYGVRLHAKAPSYHIIRIDVDTEISPIVGTERQSEDLVKYLLEGFGEDGSGIWNTQLFGRDMQDLVRENLAQKLAGMPPEVQQRARQGLSRVVNDGKSNFFCLAF